MMVDLGGRSVHIEVMEPDPPNPTTAPEGSTDTGTPTAVMVHGLASDSLASWYLTLARPLATAGIRSVMYDLRGHGHSQGPAQGYALDDFVDDLAALVDAFVPAGAVHLVGNSFGGTIAFSYAIRHPGRVASLIAIESSPPTPAWFTRVARRLGRMASYLPGEGAVDEIGARRGELAARQARRARSTLATTTLAEDLPASRLPSAAEIAAIGCPVLCLYGGDSMVVDLAPETARLLPHARIEVLPGQRHSLLIAAPALVGDVILPWLGERLTTDRDPQTPHPRRLPDGPNDPGPRHHHQQRPVRLDPAVRSDR